MKIRIAVSLFVLLASASLCFGQKSTQTNASTQISAPKGKETWAVHIVTGGGFTGRGRSGDVIINSLGEVTCGPSADAPCAYRLSPASLESLSKLIADATPSKWGASAESFCTDCYGTMMELHRRDAKGREKVYTVYWDDSTFANVPEEARRIFSEASAHTQVTPQKN